MFIRRFLGWMMLACTRWKAVGNIPKSGRYVLIAAPHTSNWDMVYMLLVSWRLGVKVHWMGKKTLFRFPFKWTMKGLGGISIDRSKRLNTVDQVVEWLHSRTHAVVVVPPEGTRRKTEYWKSGFYHIARKADVPIVLGFLDYENKRGGFGPYQTPTDDPVADMKFFRDFYRPEMARYPEKFTVPKLKEEVAETGD